MRMKKILNGIRTLGIKVLLWNYNCLIIYNSIYFKIKNIISTIIFKDYFKKLF